jgi:predicted transcriptional regulator
MAPDESALLVSVRPHYAELLLDGSKTVELRRVRPRAALGTLVLIYASSPARSLVGMGRVAAIHAADQDAVWRSHGEYTGVTREEYDAYFEGCKTAVAITLSDVKRLKRPRMLAELRHKYHGFRPPQSFRYLDAAQVAALV